MQAGENPTEIRPTRAAFIRGLPLAMPIEEVIERAREAGLVLKPSDIHSARYYMRQQSAAPEASRPSFMQAIVRGGDAPAERAASNQDSPPNKAPVARLVPNRSVVATQITAKVRESIVRGSAVERSRVKPKLESAGSPDEQLRRLVLRLGTERTREIIQDLEALASRIVRKR
jgi:hypothetical protein